MNIYPNAYYTYAKHRKNAKEKEKKKLLKEIKRLYHEANGIPGYRMMHNILFNQGIKLSVQTVRKYMNVDLGLKSVTRRPKYRYMKGTAPFKLFDNLLEQNFQVNTRNTKWCVDFTYLFVSGKQKHYNCTIIDLYDRRVVASSSGCKINSELAINTLKKALANCGRAAGIILHSDRGSQFTSNEFAEFCKKMASFKA